MALRWYSIEVDCHDTKSQAAFWTKVMDWKLVYEADDEHVIVPSWVDEAELADTPWERIGPGMVFVSRPQGQDDEETGCTSTSPAHEPGLRRRHRPPRTARRDPGSTSGSRWT